jgi:hypothetical protein
VRKAAGISWISKNILYLFIFEKTLVLGLHLNEVIMSRFVGPATQNAVIVDDHDQALRWWTQDLGVGPFFHIDHVPNEYISQHVVDIAPPAMSIASGNLGDLQIESIHPKGESTATWRQFLRTRGGGVHHVSVWSEPDNYEAEVEAALARGLHIETRGKIVGAGRYIYFRSERRGQPLLEIGELLPHGRALYDRVKQASFGWDKSDPVRSLI